jgi:hypothetical protein
VASSGFSIWVAEGTYYSYVPGGNQNNFFVPDGIDIRGGFGGFETSYLDAQPLTYKTYVSATQNGDAFGASFVIFKANHGIEFNGLHIIDNLASGASGGGHGTIQPSILMAPIEVTSASEQFRVTIRDCVFENNASTQNYSSCIRAVDFTGSVFADVIVENCLFINNTTNYSLIDFNVPSIDAQIIGCTFWQNTNTGNGANIRGAVDVQNCLFWDNTGTANVDSNVSMSHSINDLGTLPPGPGNSNANPQLIDPANGNFGLMSTSPAINAGSDAYSISFYDLAGNLRVQQGEVDMGAFESPFETPVFCLGDFNEDSIIGTGDLTIMLSEFGCTGNCLTDITGDNLVNTGDLTTLLTVFGDTCSM